MTQRIALLGLAVALAACSPGPPSPPPSPSGQTTIADSASPATAAPTAVVLRPRALRGEPEGGSPRRTEVHWHQALAGDPLDLRALAQLEGASGLLEGVEDGGDLFLVACQALPFADDADLALGRLGEIALLDDVALSETAVATIHRIAAARPSRGEALEPDGVSAAAQSVLLRAKDTSLARDRRARAVSAARAFAERGVLDPSTIPADLDPPAAPEAP